MQFITPHKTIFARLLPKWAGQLPEEDIILEIGSGLGDWIMQISQPDIRIVGLDIDAQACSIASDRVRGTGAEIILYSGDAFPFKKKAFAGAYAHEVIEHVQEDEDFFNEVHRVLKDGGSFVLTTPNGNHEPLDRHKHGAHIRHYNADELNTILIISGFETEKIYWRMHPLCGLLDDLSSQAGNRILNVQAIQPGLTYMNVESQKLTSRFLLWFYKLIEPLLSFAVNIEFNLFKTSWEARNMIFFVRKVN